MTLLRNRQPSRPQSRLPSSSRCSTPFSLLSREWILRLMKARLLKVSSHKTMPLLKVSLSRSMVCVPISKLLRRNLKRTNLHRPLRFLLLVSMVLATRQSISSVWNTQCSRCRIAGIRLPPILVLPPHCLKWMSRWMVLPSTRQPTALPSRSRLVTSTFRRTSCSMPQPSLLVSMLPTMRVWTRLVSATSSLFFVRTHSSHVCFSSAI